MSDINTTIFPKVLLSNMDNATDKEARALYDDIEPCARHLLEGIIITSRLLAGIDDKIDLTMDELRSMGNGLAVTAEIVSGCHEAMEAYYYRIYRRMQEAQP